MLASKSDRNAHITLARREWISFSIQKSLFPQSGNHDSFHCCYGMGTTSRL